MASFVVERYLPGSTAVERSDHVERVRAARERLAELGAVHRVSLVIPDDEMCMHLFDAASQADVVGAHRRAGLSFDRVVAADVHPAADLGDA